MGLLKATYFFEKSRLNFPFLETFNEIDRLEGLSFTRKLAFLILQTPFNVVILFLVFLIRMPSFFIRDYFIFHPLLM